jgi:hypothetical protein
VDGKNVNNMKIIVSKEDKEYIEVSIKSGEVLKEDLRRWFKEKWVDVSKKVNGKHPPCGRKDADGKSYPKCRPSKKVSDETPKIASSYDKKEKKAMTAQKRRAEKKDPKVGKGNKPTMTHFDESKLPKKVTCECGWSWDLKDGGNDPYVCHKCGHDNSKKYKKMNEIKIDFTSNIEKINHPTLVNENVEISNALSYHISSKKPLIENVYKIGTNGFYELLEECRDLFMNGDLELSDDDLTFIQENEYGPIEDTDYVIDELLSEAEYQGHKVQLGKIMQGDIKKFKVYVKNAKGKVVKVNFGFGGKSAKGKRMVIKKNNPERRKSFRARMNCDNPGPRWKARYWACRTW